MKNYKVKVFLKCKNCGEKFEEDCLPVNTASESGFYLGRAYYHECEFTTSILIQAPAELIKMAVYFKGEDEQ